MSSLTPGLRNSVYSDASPLSDSIDGSSGGGDGCAADSLTGTGGAAAGAGPVSALGSGGLSSVCRAPFFSRDQRDRNRSSAVIAPGTLERRRPSPLLRLRLVVLLDVLGEPRDPLRGHRHAVDMVSRVEQTRGLVVAGGDALRDGSAAFFKPVHEHERPFRGQIEVIALGLVVKQLELESGMEPLRARRVLDERARLRARLARVRDDADRLPFLRLPAVVQERRALHHHCDGEARVRHCFRLYSTVRQTSNYVLPFIRRLRAA